MSVYRPGTNKSSTLNYPTIRPTLNLDFANTKTLDSRITFTRSSAGSYVGADGLVKYAGVNEARFDHDPTTGESLGLLIEEARTNLTTYSQELDNARWATLEFTLSANTSNTTAPDGSNTAERILETTTNLYHTFYNFNSYAVTANTVYTASIFIKPINKQYVQLIFDDATTTNGGYANFDLLSGTVTASFNYGNGASISASIVSYPNNWYRISVTTTAGTSSTVARFALNGINASNTGVFTFYTGNTSNGYYIWGAQVEQGTFPTSYIPNAAGLRTRAADNTSIRGTNFSSWYNQPEGTISINFKGNKTADTIIYDRVYSINQNSAANVEEILLVYNIGYDPDRIGYLVYTNSSSIQDSTGTTRGFVTRSTSPVKTAMRYQSGNYAYVFDNQTPITSSPSKVPNPNVLDIGRVGASGYFNGTISRFTYYPKALPNAQLQALTR